MSINLIYAIDQNKVRKYGPVFGSIDFHVSTASKTSFDRLGKQITVGELLIENRKYRLTLEQIDDLVVDTYANRRFVISGEEWDLTNKEIDRVVETLKTAKHVFFQKYRLL